MSINCTFLIQKSRDENYFWQKDGQQKLSYRDIVNDLEYLKYGAMLGRWQMPENCLGLNNLAVVSVINQSLIQLPASVTVEDFSRIVF